MTKLLEGLTVTDSGQGAEAQSNNVDKDEVIKLHQKENEQLRKDIDELKKAKVGGAENNKVWIFLE